MASSIRFELFSRTLSLEMLARAGAFDVLDSNRRRVFDSLDRNNFV